ncbi:Uncharacterised protein [Klebsiella pneumoniae subsp. ozaenae]|uniref:Uncharacterized protein n=1 Tax=Klebsiella pneumoniae subsp. ozaenae TaxID=574 RepID=A0A377Z332_KLEPO|nr:Uncharacterised protein [Klebsiella pneumoniae subsp. ozaenae]
MLIQKNIFITITHVINKTNNVIEIYVIEFKVNRVVSNCQRRYFFNYFNDSAFIFAGDIKIVNTFMFIIHIRDIIYYFITIIVNRYSLYNFISDRFFEIFSDERFSIFIM